MPKSHIFIITLLLFIITGCAAKVIQTSPPSKIRVTAPSKQVPARDQIPPTQKPYHVMGRTYYPIPSSTGYVETGIASWYGNKFHGRKTSNGETYDMYGVTAAHKTLPMNTFVLVKNLENGQEAIVRINDRGPFVKGRIIDLSLTAAQQIAMDRQGTARVKITALGEAVATHLGSQTIERFRPYGDFNEGEFYVQIGSFTQKANADRLKEKMLAQGKKATTQTYETEGTNYFRVQVRAGRDLIAAREMEDLMERQFPGAFVIAR